MQLFITKNDTTTYINSVHFQKLKNNPMDEHKHDFIFQTIIQKTVRKEEPNDVKWSHVGANNACPIDITTTTSQKAIFKCICGELKIIES